VERCVCACKHPSFQEGIIVKAYPDGGGGTAAALAPATARWWTPSTATSVYDTMGLDTEKLYRVALEVQPTMAVNRLLPHPLPTYDEVREAKP
jgi:hypothetical protein